MSGLPVEVTYDHDPSGEVTNADRDDMAARLNAAFTAGDIDLETYQARLDALFQAKTRGELVPVAKGLPAQYRANEPVLGGDQPAKPGELAPLRPAPRGLVLAGAGAGIAAALLVVLLIILL